MNRTQYDLIVTFLKMKVDYIEPLFEYISEKPKESYYSLEKRYGLTDNTLISQHKRFKKIYDLIVQVNDADKKTDQLELQRISSDSKLDDEQDLDAKRKNREMRNQIDKKIREIEKDIKVIKDACGL